MLVNPYDTRVQRASKQLLLFLLCFCQLMNWSTRRLPSEFHYIAEAENCLCQQSIEAPGGMHADYFAMAFSVDQISSEYLYEGWQQICFECSV